MEVKRMFVTLTSLMALSLGPVSAQAQTGTEKVNEKFHIYLCLGQSNMEGNAKIEACDTVNVTPRFKVLQAVDCPDLGREKGKWYTAVPPLARCGTGLTPADYFGRKHSKKCTFYTLRFGCSFAAVNTIKPQLL